MEKDADLTDFLARACEPGAADAKVINPRFDCHCPVGETQVFEGNGRFLRNC